LDAGRLTKTPRVAVLGGGVSGVVAAAALNKRGILVDLIEKEHSLGGLHRSVSIDGVAYDIGAFIFGSDHCMFAAFPEVAHLFVPVVSEHTSITPSGTLDGYPMTFRGYVRDHGVSGFCRGCMDIALAKIRYFRRETMAAYVKYYLGNSIYVRTGLKNYIERLYNIPDAEVDLEFAAKRMSYLKDWASLRGTLIRLARSRDTVFTADTSHAAALVRPPQGFGAVYSAVHRILQERGVTVLTDCKILAVRCAVSGFEIDFGGETRSYDRVVSTIPLEAIARTLGIPTIEGPEYMGLFSLFYRFRGDSGHSATVLYNFTLEGRWKRVTSFSRFYGLHEGDEYFSVEGTIPQGDEGDLSLLQTDFEEHIDRLGLYRGKLTLQGAVRTGHAYPVYRKGNTARVIALKAVVQRSGIRIVGRQGDLDYISSADAAGNADEAAAQIAASLRSGALGRRSR